MPETVEHHDANPYAHNEMTSRLLSGNTYPLVKRVEALERFKAQATLLGGMAMVVLGALAYAVVERIVTKGW